MSVITTYCHLTADICAVNGDIVARRDPDSNDSWFKQIYKEQEILYPKFYKMDALSQAGFLASELIKRANPGLIADYGDDEIALVFANKTSSSETDQRFVHSYEHNGAPSPSLFVYTLPNIVLGEIAIANKWFGENIFAVLPKFVPEFFINYGRIMMPARAKAMLCGWLEFFGGEVHVFLFFVENRDKKGLNFDSEELLKMSDLHAAN